MNKFASLFAVTLLLASSSVWAEADGSADLRYCLDLKSNDEIAKCAGEIAPGEKGRPLSKEEVEKILGSEKARAPLGASESSEPPATAGDKSGNDSLPPSTKAN
jgi:hypothetical protein